MAVQGIRASQDEPTDPLYVHPSDNPGLPLVASVFNGEHFDNWKRSVIIALSAKHKLAFIDGSCECPATTSPLYTLWKRNNAMVLSWLLNSLSDNIRSSVLYLETAGELWKDSEERFGQTNKARLFQVQKDVTCLTQGEMDIASYYTKAKKLWDESHAVSEMPRCNCGKCECGVNGKLNNYAEERKLIQFLMGLNSSYTAVRGHILMMSPFPSISQAYSLLVQEERQRQVKTELHFLGENASLTANANRQPTQPEKQPDNWKTNFRKSDNRRFCDHCKRSGHSIDRCFKLHGYPSKSQGRGRGGSQTPQGRKGFSTWTDHESQETSPETPGLQLPGLNPEQSK